VADTVSFFLGVATRRRERRGDASRDRVGCREMGRPRGSSRSVTTREPRAGGVPRKKRADDVRRWSWRAMEMDDRDTGALAEGRWRCVLRVGGVVLATAVAHRA
jgi:hypothetical protein